MARGFQGQEVLVFEVTCYVTFLRQFSKSKTTCGVSVGSRPTVRKSGTYCTYSTTRDTVLPYIYIIATYSIENTVVVVHVQPLPMNVVYLLYSGTL